MGAFEEFLAAERQQESSGNYGVTNSIGALGAYQIMYYHLPTWSKEALGHSVSRAEFLSHPAEQDAIAAYEFRPVYDKHGPRGAAAWWYSGDWRLANDYRPQKNGPSIGSYVDQVMSKIGKAGSVSGGGSGSSSGGGSSAAPADNVSGTKVTTAGLQAAGYEAAIDLTPWGIPLNPFKYPGWLGGKLGGLLGDGASGAAGGVASGMWDALGPVVLAALGVSAGVGAVLIGLYVTARPAVEKAEQTVGDVAPLAV